MNTEERILTALRCEEPDRVPVVVYLNPYTSNWVTNDRSYRRLLEATREYADVIYDAYFTLPLADDESRQTTDLGGGRTKESIQTPRGEIFRVLREHARGVEKHLVESAEDALKLLSIPQPGYEPDLSEFLRVRDELRGEAVAQVTLADPICIIGDSFSPEFLSLCTIAHRELLLELAETYFRRSTALLEYLLYNDAGPIYYFNGPEYALPPLMSPRDFDELVVAYDRELVRQVHERGKVATSRRRPC